MATEGLVRPGVTAAAARAAVDAFAGRHRYRLLEALPWVAAIARLGGSAAPRSDWSEQKLVAMMGGVSAK